MFGLVEFGCFCLLSLWSLAADLALVVVTVRGRLVACKNTKTDCRVSVFDSVARACRGDHGKEKGDGMREDRNSDP